MDTAGSNVVSQAGAVLLTETVRAVALGRTPSITDDPHERRIGAGSDHRPVTELDNHGVAVA